MEKEADFPLCDKHKVDCDLSYKIEDIECTCRGELQPACKVILPIGINSQKVIVYNSCKRTVYAAFKRQLKRVIQPDPEVVKDLQKFMEQYFKDYVEPHLIEFQYSYSQWFNSMPYHKQQKILNIDKQKLAYNEYGLFCKREKQEFGGKNRAILNISSETKFVMGPIVWFLEEIAAQHFPGYCGGKNWDQLEAMLTKNYKDGYTTTVQGDGSGYDLSQHYENKHIDRLIYTFIADNCNIHHVDPQIFKSVSTARYRKMKATYTKDGRMYTLGNAIIDGTVFSGSSDTTFGNTLRMAIYNMFTLHKAGLEYEKDYRLICKGDDFCVFTKDAHLDYEKLYYKYWCQPIKKPWEHDYTPYGIGNILKFLKVGDYSDFDFCSTVCIPDYDKAIFKLARKPERMNPLNHYSRAALSMSKGELKQYYHEMAFAIQ